MSLHVWCNSVAPRILVSGERAKLVIVHGDNSIDDSYVNIYFFFMGLVEKNFKWLVLVGG